MIRVSEKYAKGLCPNNSDWLLEDQVDKEIFISIGRRHSKKLANLENYHYISTSKHYDYAAPRTDDIDTLKLRVLKFPISENSYEYIVTNLPAYMFSSGMIKKLYFLRWNEETAFRHLKYAGSMVHIHSLKREFLIQEIYAKLTLLVGSLRRLPVCLFQKQEFLTVNPRTGYILLGFIMFIIIYCYQDFGYLNDIGTVLLAHNTSSVSPFGTDSFPSRGSLLSPSP